MLHPSWSTRRSTRESTSVFYGTTNVVFTCFAKEIKVIAARPVTEIRLKSHQHVTFYFPSIRSLSLCRRIRSRLGRETNPSNGHFEVGIEEIDSGKQLKFQSSTELLRFLGERFQAILVEGRIRLQSMTRAKRANKDSASG